MIPSSFEGFGWKKINERMLYLRGMRREKSRCNISLPRSDGFEHAEDYEVVFSFDTNYEINNRCLRVGMTAVFRQFRRQNSYALSPYPATSVTNGPAYARSAVKKAMARYAVFRSAIVGSPLSAGAVA